MENKNETNIILDTLKDVDELLESLYGKDIIDDIFTIHRKVQDAITILEKQ